MQKFNVVKTPVNLYGMQLKFNAVYGKFMGIVYYVDDYTSISANVLNAYVYKPELSKWVRVSTRLNKKWDVLRDYVIPQIRAAKVAHLIPSDYIRNKDIRECGAPKERKPQTSAIFRIPNVGYALNKHVITDVDAMRRIRTGVTYFPA